MIQRPHNNRTDRAQCQLTKSINGDDQANEGTTEKFKIKGIRRK